MATILVVDDEPSVRDLARAYLERDGFGVRTADDGLEALRLAEAEPPDLVVLDLMLPKLDGLEVCKRLRAEGNLPILMLTARGEEFERVLGLELGADDYMVKPFSPRELVARIRAILRRVSGEIPAPTLRFGELRIDPTTRAASLAGRALELSALEFDLLHALASSPGKVWTRDELIRRVWGEDFPGVDRVVDVHIVSLRRKLLDEAANPRFIGTVRGVGYRFTGGEA